MKRRVFQIITLLFVSTFILTPVIADHDGLPMPSLEGVHIAGKHLYVMRMLDVWDPEGSEHELVGQPAVDVNKDNHFLNFVHDDLIDIQDFGEMLDLCPTTVPSRQLLTNFHTQYGITLTRPQGIEKIDVILEKYEADAPFYRNNISTHGTKVLRTVKTMLRDMEDVSKNGDTDFVDLILVANQLRKTEIPNPKFLHFGVDAIWVNWRDADRNSRVDTRDIIFVTKNIADTSIAAAKTALASAELRESVKNLTVTVEAIDLWLTDSAVQASGKTRIALNHLKAALAPDADVDLSGTVDFEDLIHVSNAVKGTIAPDTMPDVNRDLDIDVDDILFVAGEISPIDEIKQSILETLWTPMLEIRPLFTEKDVDTWKQQTTGDAVTVLNQLRQGIVIAWMDVDADGDIDFEDLIKVGNAIHGVNSNITNLRGNPPGVHDIILVASGVAQGDISLQVAQDAVRSTPPEFTAANVASWITEAKKQTGTSHIQTVLQYLKEAIETREVPKAPQGAVDAPPPKKTELLANYPNPFNPETWIPYQLATPAEVSIAIYAADGRQVRTLNIGHLPAGRYYAKHRAAYWDGRNAQGEPVASGLYFYTFTAGEFTATQKLLIRK